MGGQGPARPEPERARGRRRHGARPQRQADRGLEPGRPLPRHADAPADGTVCGQVRARGRGPQLLQPRSARPRVDRTGGVGGPDVAGLQRRRQHNHPAAGEDSAAHAAEVFHTKGPGDGARDRARAALLERPDPRHVHEPRVLRAWSVRRRRCRPHVLQQRREGLDARAGRVPGGSHPGPHRLRSCDPLRRRTAARALRPARHGFDRRAEPGGRRQGSRRGHQKGAPHPGERPAEQGAALRRLRALRPRDHVWFSRHPAGRHRRPYDARPRRPAERAERGRQRRARPRGHERQQFGVARRRPEKRRDPGVGRVGRLRQQLHRRPVRRRPLEAPAWLFVQALCL